MEISNFELDIKEHLLLIQQSFKFVYFIKIKLSLCKNTVSTLEHEYV